MRKFKSLFLITFLVSIALGNFAFAQDSGPAKQEKSRLDNTIKAFVHDWYARFDNGPTIDQLMPNLADDKIEFIFPQAKITDLSTMREQFEASWATTDQSAHDMGEVMVHNTSEPDVYETINPHTYYLKRVDGETATLNIIGRMRVQLPLKTERDPEGDLPKLISYRVLIEGAVEADIESHINDLKHAGLSASDAKAFVHTWFSHADAKDVNAMLNMTSESELDVNLLGTEIVSKKELQQYLNANGEAQTWATHQPHNISVNKTADGFETRFFIHFEGNINGVGNVILSNVTNWLLVEENGSLKLKNYTLELL